MTFWSLFNKTVRLMRSGRRGAAGFSLVEVTMSLGIMAFGALSILGGMGVGLISLKDARSIQTQATIIAQVRGKLQQMSLTETSGTTSMSTFVASPLYFTNEGVSTDLGSTDNPAYYKVTMTQASASVEGNHGPATFLTKNAQTIKVKIAYPATAMSPTENEVPLLVARQRQ